ncbi:MAG: electron transfer flavoprotein subunit beta/FixA family protein [Anaerolineae bacterium]
MKILAACKRVPDANAQVRVRADGQDIETEGLQWTVSEPDEVAIEEALRIRERLGEGEVVLLSIGPPEAQQQLRQGFALGADRGILVVAEGFVDSDLAARVFERIYHEEQPDLILLGRTSPDNDASQVGPLLAGRLGRPQATFASKVDILDDGAAEVVREVDGGIECVRVPLPAIITCDFKLNEPRYPPLRLIMQARKKEIRQLALTDLDVEPTPRVRVLRMEPPPEGLGGIIVESVQELVDRLRSEAKVL